MWVKRVDQGEFRDFIWNNGKAKIVLKQLAKSYEEGGLKLTDLSTMNNAIKISWIKWLCVSKGGFQSIFSYSISDPKEHVCSLDDESFKMIKKEVKTPFWNEFSLHG